MEGKVAPHEAKEFVMILAGEKPIATVVRDKNERLYNLVKQTGFLLSTEEHYGVLAFCLPENSHLLAVWSELFFSRMHPTLYMIQMGRLFGYSEADILKFMEDTVTNENPCDCIECLGYHRWTNK
jgi:hypothetical protein